MNTEPPETDKLFAPLWAKDDPPTDVELHEVTKSHRRIERERDEARAIARFWQEQYGHACPEHEWQDLPWESNQSAF